MPENAGLPENVPDSDPPSDRVAVPETVSFPVTDSDPSVVRPVTFRVPLRVVLPVTPSVPDTVSFPDTARPSIVVALSVDGIWPATRLPNDGTADDPPKLPKTVYGDWAMSEADKSHTVVQGDPVVRNRDEGRLKLTTETVPVPLLKIEKLSANV
jgi:hypothetical protein